MRDVFVYSLLAAVICFGLSGVLTVVRTDKHGNDFYESGEFLVVLVLFVVGVVSLAVALIVLIIHILVGWTH